METQRMDARTATHALTTVTGWVRGGGWPLVVAYGVADLMIVIGGVLIAIVIVILFILASLVISSVRVTHP